MLDGIEKVGNKVPHPVIMFLVPDRVRRRPVDDPGVLRRRVTETVAVPVPTQVLEDLSEQLGGLDRRLRRSSTRPDLRDPRVHVVRSRRSRSRACSSTTASASCSRRSSTTSPASRVVAVTFVAMMGVGVAEKAGMMGALIRKLVAVAPAALLAFFIIFVGVLSSVASDAGYLILIPLARPRSRSVGRHPLAGLAAAYAGVGCIFAVNVLITPVDSMLTEITNEAIGQTGAEHVDGHRQLLLLDRLVDPDGDRRRRRDATHRRAPARRLRRQRAATRSFQASSEELDEDAASGGVEGPALRHVRAARDRGAGRAADVPIGAPLRDPETGDIIGNTPFMDSLIFLITLIFLICGICYGIGAKTITSSNDVIDGVTQTFAGLAGLIFMLLMIAQFIAFFNWTNMPRVAAVELAHLLEQAGWGALPLLIGMILVILLLDIIIPGVVPKWAIFAPVFIPIFVRLDVAPQTVLAAYRVGDSPMNVVTPLMVYLPFIVTVAQRYQKKAGIGTIIALMLPYVLFIAVSWIVLFAVWWVLRIPLGPGSPIEM